MQVEMPFNYAIVKKYPEQVTIVLARESTGKINPITIGWTMLTSHNPPMMAISVGLTRHSLGVIRDAKEFVIAFPSELQEREAYLFGVRSGRDTDKLALSGIRTLPATRLNNLLLADAVANFECRLVEELPTGDHVIFVGEVVASHVNPEAPGRLYTIAKGGVMGAVRGQDISN